MTITVYYGEQNNFFLEEPKSVLKSFSYDQKNADNSSHLDNVHMCPSFINYYHNTFSISSDFSWELNWDGNEFVSNNMDQSAFNNHFLIRNKSSGLVSSIVPGLYLIPDKPVDIELLNPTLSDSDINKKTSVMQGVFNPYYHIRPTELAFRFLNVGDTIKYYPGEDLYYIRFLTKERIKFKKFYFTQNINNIITNNLSQKSLDSRIRNLKWWYEVSKNMGIRKQVMKDVLSNLCD